MKQPSSYYQVSVIDVWSRKWYIPEKFLVKEAVQVYVEIMSKNERILPSDIAIRREGSKGQTPYHIFKAVMQIL